MNARDSEKHARIVADAIARFRQLNAPASMKLGLESGARSVGGDK